MGAIASVVAAMSIPERQSTFTRFPPVRHPRRLRAAALVVAVLIVAIAVASVVLFIEPATNVPARSDAVIVLAGGNNSARIAKGLALVRAGYAPRLFVSDPGNNDCPKSLPSVPVTCFNPNPTTTQGEARFTARLAGQHHWHRIIVVSGTQQVTRARIRFDRCYHGSILMVPADPGGLFNWVYTVAYEWGALPKALIFQRGC
ncbi:MAG TPA: YdcF family protein [Acidimicrobiales bacterium]|nr:YdcF family protein [Acidimicrobiales bacterium]